MSSDFHITGERYHSKHLRGGTDFFGEISCPVTECVNKEGVASEYQYLSNFQYRPMQQTVTKSGVHPEGDSELVMFFKGECGHDWELIFRDYKGHVAIGVSQVYTTVKSEERRRHDD